MLKTILRVQETAKKNSTDRQEDNKRDIRFIPLFFILSPLLKASILTPLLKTELYAKKTVDPRAKLHLF